MGLPIIPTGMCIFWDSESNPNSGWTEITGKDDSLIVINSSVAPGTGGGGSTHTHPITGSLLTSSSGAINSGDGNAQATYQQHTHSVSGTSSGAKSYPNVSHLRVFQKNGTTSVSSFPSGAIVMYDSGTPPTGWSSYPSGYSNAYVKFETSNLGKTYTWHHPHSFNLQSANNSNPVGQSDSGENCPYVTHKHSVAGATDDYYDASWELSRISVKFIKKTGTTRFSQTPHYIYCLYYSTGTPGGSWSELTGYDGRYLKTGTGDIATGSAANATHTHTVTNGTSGSATPGWGNDGYHAQCILKSHTHTYSLAAGNGTHQDPGYVTFRLFRISVTSFSDIGIRYRSSGVTYKIGAEDLLGTHKLRISYGGVTYGIPLLATSDGDATPVYIYDGAAVKALASIN
ncbi:MAG TPA: hypothetical protein VMW91_01100 [Desulfosporosinus sp.]|nr:hypothetical protein [Desulfosporosinus sp.]